MIQKTLSLKSMARPKKFNSRKHISYIDEVMPILFGLKEDFSDDVADRLVSWFWDDLSALEMRDLWIRCNERQRQHIAFAWSYMEQHRPNQIANTTFTDYLKSCGVPDRLREHIKYVYKTRPDIMEGMEKIFKIGE